MDRQTLLWSSVSQRPSFLVLQPLFYVLGEPHV